ncbi:MAG: hypothetical protein CL758_07055 [Chloroflexi bacterium]|nr:hypothetical protein [Chloroflexota bacterium]|tara:strand:- start:14531 stop:15178 length:648 start_codon:yes stop_codon:yes gene_type:complete
MNLSDFVIIVPIKSLDLAKSRLKYHITEKERFNIIINMFLGVLKASKKSLSKEVWIICKDKIFKDICDFFNVRWIEDEGYGLNIILNDLFLDAFKKQLTPIYIPSDLPFITAKNINQAINLSNNGKNFVFSPAFDGKGTNLIISPILSNFSIKLGDNSLIKHTEQVFKLNSSFNYCKEDGLIYDLDTLDGLNLFSKNRPDIIDNLKKDIFQNYAQ